MSGGSNLPGSIQLVEVGLRDGLQALEARLSTEDKLRIVDSLIASGVSQIEVTSFAHPRVLPQFSDTEELLARIPRGVAGYRALVPNLKGAERAGRYELDTWTFVISADSEVSVRNQRRTTEQMLDELGEVARLARGAGAELVVAVACAFFAPASGVVPWETTMEVVRAAAAVGARGVYLATTTGQEHPLEVAAGVAAVREAHPELQVGVHLHNRNGFAPANALAAMEAGVTWLEASVCGLGGDAWFPGDPSVLGNYAMEDLLHLCDGVGVATGIDLTQYLVAVRQMEQMTGSPSTSFVTRGGTRTDLARASWPEA